MKGGCGTKNDDNKSIDEKVNGLSEIITSKANGYFQRNVTYTAHSFTDYEKQHKTWFDAECRRKQSLYKQSLQTFLCHRNDECKRQFLQHKCDYKFHVRKVKRLFNSNRARSMNEMRYKKPREFWKIFKGPRNAKKDTDTLKSEDIFKHFEQLSQRMANDEPDVAEFVGGFNERERIDQPSYAGLDYRITLEEVRKACKTIDIMVHPFAELFYQIFDTVVYPKNWSIEVIIPLLKKQPADDPNNYRGITLISCLAKLFTTVINERLKKWANANDKLSGAQFGFKQKHGTSDAATR
ncbi:hypothetical protein MAR_010601 [Mya arenaria]|uniref:Reverse transcriptase domain-containing protein n=1 Tax=Mya arenaria TaxID=6604 RepID=A0ABY7E5G9_MYAAR|nr:hypothetical protein MAR_010601 [Mya arenaria]